MTAELSQSSLNMIATKSEHKVGVLVREIFILYATCRVLMLVVYLCIL